jgi:phosphatidylglycerophosphate synthase
MNKILNGLFNGTKNGFKLTDFVLRKIDYWRDKILFPLLKRYWPQAVTPNHLSNLKIVIAIFIGLFLVFRYQDKRYIIPLYLIGLFLDLIDGAVARALNKKTRIGSFLDPLGDKLLNGTIAVYLLWQDYMILLVALLIPEIISVLVAIFCFFQRQPVESNIFGKTKMCCQSGAFIIILFSSPGPVSLTVLWAAVGLAVISLIIKGWEWATGKIYVQN